MNTGLRILVVVALLTALGLVVFRMFQLEEPPGVASPPVETRGPYAAVTTADWPRYPLPSSDPVAGVVVDPNGLPIAGVRVTLNRILSPWPESRIEEIDSIRTGEEGRFRFLSARAPDQIVIAEHSSWALQRVEAHEQDSNVTVRMHPGFAVSGIVLDPDGDPVPDCEVVLEPGNWDMRRALRVTTDRRGAFRSPRILAGIVRVSARHRAYQPAIEPAVTVGASDGLTLRFRDPALVLTGRVMTTEYPPEPVSGGVVRALPNTWNRGLFAPWETRSDDQGRFLLEGLGRGNLRVEVRHRQLSTSSRVVAMRAATQPLTIEMGPRSRVAGELVGSVSAEALDGIELVLSNTVGEKARTLVNADGEFEFYGTFSSGPAAIELARGTLAFTRTSSRDLGVMIEDANTTSLSLSVTPPSIVEGLIIDEDGQPLAGACILISRQHQMLPAPDKLVAVTGDDGWFRIAGMPVGRVFIQVTHQERANQFIRLQVPAPGETERVPDIVLPQAGDIFGRVSLGEKPLAGALVSASLDTGTFVVAVTEPDGRYRLRDLSPGSYRLRAQYSTLPVALADDTVEVESGTVKGPIPLRFPAGRTISGVVEGSDGLPLEDAAVTVSGTGGAVVFTDASGHFSLEVPRRDLELQAYSADLSRHTARIVSLADSEVILRLETALTGTLRARVLGLPGRRPVPGGIIRVTPLPEAGSTRGTPIASRWMEVSTGGELRILDFPVGASRFIFQAPGYGPLVRDVEVSSRRVTDLGEILLEPGNTVRGVVTDADGDPVPGAAIYLGSEIDWQQFEPEVSTDAEGQFELRGVTPDSRTVVIAAPEYAITTIELRIPEDILRPEPVPVAVDRGSTIEVTILDSRGRPWEMSVAILKLDGSVIETGYADEEGLIFFPHRGPGSYEVTLFGSQGVNQQVLVGEQAEIYEVVLRSRN